MSDTRIDLRKENQPEKFKTEQLPTSTVKQSQGLFARYHALMCTSISSSVKWG